MRNPFALRRPWAAALIALIFGPFVGFLYLGRGGTALAWLVAELCFALAVIAFIPQLIAASQPVDAGSVGEWAFHVVGCVPAYFVARRRDPGPPPVWYARWYALVALGLAIPAVAFACRTFLYEPFTAASGTMRPTMDTGDVFFVSKLAYNGHAPARGDVIVFRIPSSQPVLVKRVVGMPGDLVWLRDGVVFINGVALRQRRVGSYAVSCEAPAPCRAALMEERLPNGRHYLVVDRGASVLDGTRPYRVPPDSYFVLGDDRDDSWDSREDDFGFVARNDIVGPATDLYETGGHWTWREIR